MDPASVEYMNRQRFIPKLRQWTMGATVNLGFVVCDRLVTDFYVYLNRVFVFVIIGGFVYWMVALFIFVLFFILIIFKKKFILLTLFYFIFLSFFSPFSSEPCGSQGLSAMVRCQVWASEVGEQSTRHWTTRDLLASHNINQQEISQRSLSQH